MSSRPDVQRNFEVRRTCYKPNLSKYMPSKFAQVLREIRRTKNICQRELAQKSGVDFSYFIKIENDRLPPAADTIVRICDVLGTPQEQLLVLSGKVSNEMKETIASSPAAMQFIEAKRQSRRFRSIIFKNSIDEAIRLLFRNFGTDDKEDRQQLIESLSDLRTLIEEHISDDTVRIWGKI